LFRPGGWDIILAVRWSKDKLSAPDYIIFCLVLFSAHTVQGITGFGAVVLALPFLTQFTPLPLSELIPVLIAINLVQAGWVAWSERRRIDRRRAATMLVLAAAGLPIGLALYHWLPADHLKTALGSFVALVAVYNLARREAGSRVPVRFYLPLNFIGGIAQGALAIGGPFLVIYAARVLPDKSDFRATLMLTWTALNIVLCATHAAAGSYTPSSGLLIAAALPLVIAGNYAGLALHQRVPERPFRIGVFSILLVSGLALI